MSGKWPLRLGRWLLAAVSRKALLASVSLAAAYVAFAVGTDTEAARTPLLFFVLPVVLCGIGYGLRGGIMAAAAGSALLWWGADLSSLGMGVRAFELVTLGAVVGLFADERRRMIRATGRRDELSLDLVATANQEGWYTSVNPAFTNVLGFSADELKGRPFVDFLHPEDRARTLAELEEQFETGRDVVNAVNRHRTKSGEYRWLEWTSSVDETGGTIVSFARDVTERAQAEEQARLRTVELEVALEDAREANLRLNLVAEAVTDGLVTVDENGTIVRFNTSSERIFGYRREEVVGASAEILTAGNGQEGSLARYLRTGEDGIIGVRHEVRGRRKDGSVVPLECTIGEVSRRGERLFIAVVRDITDEKQREAVAQDYTHFLQQVVGERTAELRRLARELDDARLETLSKLALAAEYRDDQTYAHAIRVGNTAAMLGELLGLTALEVERIRQAAPLHDIGKLAVSDTILLKRGELSEAQWHQMHSHTTVGHEILAGSTSDVLSLAAEIALTHHERWDGSGYPAGLEGEQIPLSGRIVALADVFDSLCHERPYKPAWTVEDAKAEIHRLSGRQFDPAVVDAFAQLDHHELIDPAERDHPPPGQMTGRRDQPARRRPASRTWPPSELAPPERQRHGPRRSGGYAATARSGGTGPFAPHRGSPRLAGRGIHTAPIFSVVLRPRCGRLQSAAFVTQVNLGVLSALAG